MGGATNIGVALAASFCLAGALDAAVISVFTDKAAWEAAASKPFLTEDFADAQLNAGVSVVSSESGHINPSLEVYQDVLASTSQNEPTTVWTFAPAVTGFGGNWTLGGPGGSGNSLQVYIADSSEYVGFISNSYSGGFWGFMSDVPLESVRLVGGSGTHQQHYSLDDMVYVPIPEPGTLVLAWVGVGVVMAGQRCCGRGCRQYLGR